MTDEEINRKFDLVAGHLASLAVYQQRADEHAFRLERTLLLAIRAGRRERSQWRARHAALVDAQIRTEETLGRLAEKVEHLAEAQTHSDRRLDALIDIVREDSERRKGRRGEARDAGGEES